MKKKILFVTYLFNCGGVEKALINYLNIINRKKYRCEILTIMKEGTFLSSIPKDITVKEYKAPRYIKLMAKSPVLPDLSEEKNILKRLFWYIIFFLNKVTVKFFKKNIMFYFIYKIYYKNNSFKDYDAIVDFHGYGSYTTYISAYEKGKTKKFSWIHEQNIYNEYSYISNSYKHFDHIFGCSNECCDNFIKKFSNLKQKVSTCHNYVDINEIYCKSKQFFPEQFRIDRFKIVSVGRVGGQKKFDRVIETSKILLKLKNDFFWIVVGDGNELKKLREIVKKEDLQEYICFVGFEDNPYPYIKNADLYVQTSVAEGFCTTITEAIVLGKPVISTKVGGVDEQIVNGQNGYIVDHKVEDIAFAIDKLIKDSSLLKQFSHNSELKNMDYRDEIEKLLQKI